MTLSGLVAEDWRKLNHGGHESLTQAVGRAAAACGEEAMLVPSAFVRRGVNVVCFPRNLGPASTATVQDAARLERLPRKEAG